MHDAKVASLVITGFSGSGKTTFIEKLIQALKTIGYRPGYLKHAGGNYDLDVPGKDSYRQKAAGASFAAVFTDTSWALHHTGEIDELLLQTRPQTDLILLEGFKTNPAPKIVCLHPSKGVPDALHWNIADTDASVFAYLTPTENQAQQINETVGKPIAFQRDTLQPLVSPVLAQLKHYYQQKSSLYSAVMVGGQSSRMGADKAWLDYGSGPQALHLFQLFSRINAVQKTFFSGAPQSFFPPEVSEKTIIRDRFLNFGPLGGFLTLFESAPQQAWLVAACDLAGLQPEAIHYLIQHRNPLKAATIYVNQRQKWEPLLAIYEPRMGLHLKQALLHKTYSLQKIFANLSIESIPIPDNLQSQFINVNTPEERRSLLETHPPQTT